MNTSNCQRARRNIVNFPFQTWKFLFKSLFVFAFFFSFYGPMERHEDSQIIFHGVSEHTGKNCVHMFWMSFGLLCKICKFLLFPFLIIPKLRLLIELRLFIYLFIYGLLRASSPGAKHANSPSSLCTDKLGVFIACSYNWKIPKNQ